MIIRVWFEKGKGDGEERKDFNDMCKVKLLEFFVFGYCWIWRVDRSKELKKIFRFLLGVVYFMEVDRLVY